MREKSNYQYVDDLILGMKTILSEKRCSFSDEEKVLLANAIKYLEDSKKDGEVKPIDWSIVFRGINLLTRVFSHFEDFTNLF